MTRKEREGEKGEGEGRQFSPVLINPSLVIYFQIKELALEYLMRFFHSTNSVAFRKENAG